MASLKYSGNANFQTGTLSASYTSGGSSLSLTSGHGSRFPSSGDFWVRIDDEVFKVTSVSGDTLTVSGAQDGTSAANHASGSTVRWVLSAAALNQLRSDLIQEGTYASLPSASDVSPGTLYLTTDSVYQARSDGSSWTYFYNGYKVIPPPASGWTAINSGSADFTYGYGLLIAAAGAGENIRAVVRAAPATPYTLTVTAAVGASQVNYNGAGIIWRQSSDGKLIVFGTGQGGGGTNIDTSKMTNPTTWSASYGGIPHPATGIIHFRIRDDGVNRISSFSIDGQYFKQFHSVARTDWLTADQFGFYANANNATYPAAVTVIGWKLV